MTNELNPKLVQTVNLQADEFVKELKIFDGMFDDEISAIESDDHLKDAIRLQGTFQHYANNFSDLIEKSRSDAMAEGVVEEVEEKLIPKLQEINDVCCERVNRLQQLIDNYSKVKATPRDWKNINLDDLKLGVN